MSEHARKVRLATIESFADDLATEGFIEADRRGPAEEWSGLVRHGNDSTLCVVQLSDNFPFAPPRVFLPEYTSDRSWHREKTGALCLWSEAEKIGLPWLDPIQIRSKVEAWLTADASGWRDQPPALDLEAYIEPDVELRFVHIEDWTKIRDQWLIFEVSSLVPSRLDVRSATAGTAEFRRNRSATIGRAVDIGEQSRPVETWSQLADLIRPGFSS